MDLIDSHCHIDFPDFDDDRAEVLARAAARGVEALVVPGVVAAAWSALLSLCREREFAPRLVPALGLHPYFIEQHTEADLDTLAQLLSACGEVAAVGEIGLDFYIDNPDKARQHQLFEAQLELARRFELPVILHVRKAHEQVLATLKRLPVCGGIVHAFSGSREQAQRYIELGYKLGFGGMLSYERSRKLRALAADLPLSSIVLETDAPDMSGAAYRGRRNSPEYLPDYFQSLVALRSESADEVASVTAANVRELFGARF